jgi:hypothetical protein
MTRKSTSQRDVQNWDDSSIEKPVDQDKGVNRHREGEPTLPPTELF